MVSRLNVIALGAALFAGSHCFAEPVFVTNEMSGDLTVLDGVKHTLIATIPLGKRPRGIRVSPDGKLLYVALSGSPIAGPGVDESTLPPPDKAADGIGVVDIAARKVVRTLKGVSDPEQLALSPDGGRLYVASEDGGAAVVFDTGSGKILASLPVGAEPEGVAVSPNGHVAYVTSESEGTVSVIDARSNKVLKQFKVGQRPRSVVFAPDGARAYVTGENDASVSIVDARKHEVIQKITLEGEGIRPMGVGISPNGQMLYVATGRAGKLVALDTKTFKTRWSVPVGQRPWGVAVSPNGARVYTANGPSNDVAVVDTRTHTVIEKIAVGNRPWGVTSSSQNSIPLSGEFR